MELRVNIVLPRYTAGPLLVNIMAFDTTQISFGSHSRSSARDQAKRARIRRRVILLCSAVKQLE